MVKVLRLHGASKSSIETVVMEAKSYVQTPSWAGLDALQLGF